ncbi:uncharacterized protein LOC102802833 [Saccoglossus kowalevskii]
MNFSHSLLTLVVLICFITLSNGNTDHDECASECDGTCRKKHCNDNEHESDNPSCMNDCAENKGRICCVGGVVGNECASDCDGQCRKKHCNDNEIESTNPSCVQDCADNKGRICCVVDDDPTEYDCESTCGGTCRKHCKRGEQDAEPVDECVATCLTDYRCCVPDHNECKNICNGECRSKHCDREEKESNNSICVKDCDDKNGRICCVPDTDGVNNECESECNGQCRTNNCDDDEIETTNPSCIHIVKITMVRYAV